ncbi:hypothetical protein Dsin_019367 [Dipteronia sinensis]|uniref:Reverse transcriptase domain-containing protein n=1 Tax=Dipteronia sinensis TaxID=43782 RepID=A0AAE0A8K0_9ROSI|nr:hypothetical protein Dsin_019367 [Dipteronia sinensis]
MPKGKLKSINYADTHSNLKSGLKRWKRYAICVFPSTSEVRDYIGARKPALDEIESAFGNEEETRSLKKQNEDKACMGSITQILAARFSRLCLGDFNEILCDYEKHGHLPRSRQLMEDFRRVLDSCGLEDMGYHGAQFIWCNKRDRDDMIRERLERGVCNMDCANGEMGRLTGAIANCSKQLASWNARNRFSITSEILRYQNKLMGLTESRRTVSQAVVRQDTVGNDVVAGNLKCLNSEDPINAVNNPLVCLIPKVLVPVRVTEFRPISLYNVTYKIVAKALANRLRVVLAEVIYEAQSAFIPGRLISDNAIIGFESLHMLRTRKWKKSFIALKLDMLKANDRVEWGFLDKVMVRLGFSDARIRQVMGCVTRVSFSFLIIGKLCGSVAPTCGLRQKDLMSPHLYIIVAEGLSSLIQDFVTEKEYVGYKSSHSVLEISHLFFTDNSTLFSRADDSDCRHIRGILGCYSNASVQIINYEKLAVCFRKAISNEEGTVWLLLSVFAMFVTKNTCVYQVLLL